jgi:NADPH:quinone reductase-like Zn-dependent oxidoreductase
MKAIVVTDEALDLDRSPRAGPDAVDPRPRGGRSGHRPGAQEFVDLENDSLENVGDVNLVFDVFGGDIGKRSAGLVRAGGMLVTVGGPPTAWRSTSLSCPIAPN